MGVFEDISLERILPLQTPGEGLYDDMFLFNKGNICNPVGYNILSSGEKAAFDLLLEAVLYYGSASNDNPVAH